MYNRDMINRTLLSELAFLAREYTVVTIVGPRQSGKTTLCKMRFPDYNYANLEHPDIRLLASTDPNSFFEMFPAPVIIDEIQRVPDLLSYIQVFADNTNLKGQYILTGSHQLALREAVSQSLAGRTALLELLPLSIQELSATGVDLSRDEYIQQGFYPRIYAEDMDPFRLHRNYFQTYVERDVRQILKIKDLSLFEQFVRLLAGRVGQVLNLHSMTAALGVSGKTLKEWISVLEASFVVYRLPPYFENFGKRIVKSSKLYFTDTGLLCYLLGIETPAQVARDPLLGALFENLVVIEALKSRLNQGRDPNLFYFRDNNQNEVDLIFKQGRTLVPMEIKASMTYHADFSKGLRYFRKIVPSSARGFVVFSGEVTPDLEDATVVNFKKTGTVFI